VNNTINKKSTEDNSVLKLHTHLDGALTLSAPITWRQAPQTCYHNSETNYSCLDYHRIWQYFVLLGITTSVRTDSAFLINTFRELASDESNKRVLVSGTADYTLLAHILYAYKQESKDVNVTVVDLCETALASNRWYAERNGLKIETIQADILNYAKPDCFDVICTHSFLGWFSPVQQSKLINNWHKLLRSGGKVITTRRLRSGDPDKPHGYSEEDALALKKKAYKAAMDNRQEHKLDPEKIAEAAYNFAKLRSRYETGTEEAFRDLFTRSGLRVVSMDYNTSLNKHQDKSTGPARGSSKRLRIIAQKD
jgi:SAM-dependent methyltransferase